MYKMQRNERSIWRHYLGPHLYSSDLVLSKGWVIIRNITAIAIPSRGFLFICHIADFVFRCPQFVFRKTRSKILQFQRARIIKQTASVVATVDTGFIIHRQEWCDVCFRKARAFRDSSRGSAINNAFVPGTTPCTFNVLHLPCVFIKYLEMHSFHNCFNDYES